MDRPRAPLAVLLLVATACRAESAMAGADAGAGEPIPKGVITGKVIDASSAPVSGARVTLYRFDRIGTRWGTFKVERGDAETDGTGTYRFEALKDGYYLVSAEKAGFARGLRNAAIENGASQEAEVVLAPPASVVLRVEDRDGKPIAGARVRDIRARGRNGAIRLPQLWLRPLGLAIPASDAGGLLRLPPLPSGEVVELTVDHPGHSPARIRELKAAPGATARVTLQPGVTVTLRVPTGPQSPRISGAVIDFRHEPFDDPSTVLDDEVVFDDAGAARLTVAPGDYSWLLLQHRDFYVTPVHAAGNRKKSWLRLEPGRNRELHFDVRRKVKVSGRVINADTGKPLRAMSLLGELCNGDVQGWEGLLAQPWSFAGWAETDEQGRFMIELAAGLARVSFHGNDFMAEREFYEVSVAADGSTSIPDIRVRPLRKVVGVVKNPDGTPAPRAVVRLRGRALGHQPVLTDGSGRFEIQPEWVPVDPETGRRAPAQQVVAFDPYRPLAARAAVRLDRPEEIVLRLEPHDSDWPLSALSSDLSDWERGIVPPAEAARYAAVSLRGQTPPEIDAALWLNAGGPALKLADLRGKYVLLDFWFIGCGPCHGDFPSVRLVHELYRDRGVVVIGVHNNTSTPEAIREHVARLGLPFPVAVDHSDGRTVAKFEEHGLPNGYPDYVLIGPDGKVLFDDRTIPSPSLRSYKLEIIRKLLLQGEAASR
ncbi:MAG: carboxypeptidase regulatory-like domain-containing protein [Isosphaeraceae bacterium]